LVQLEGQLVRDPVHDAAQIDGTRDLVRDEPAGRDRAIEPEWAAGRILEVGEAVAVVVEAVAADLHWWRPYAGSVVDAVALGYADGCAHGPGGGPGGAAQVGAVADLAAGGVADAVAARGVAGNGGREGGHRRGRRRGGGRGSRGRGGRRGGRGRRRGGGRCR